MGNRIVVQSKEVVYNEEVKSYSHRGKIVKIYNVWINGELTDMDDIKGTYIHERIMRDLDNRLNDKISTHKYDFYTVMELLRIRYAFVKEKGEFNYIVNDETSLEPLIKRVLHDELIINSYKQYLYNNLVDETEYSLAMNCLNDYLEVAPQWQKK